MSKTTKVVTARYTQADRNLFWLSLEEMKIEATRLGRYPEGRRTAFGFDCRREWGRKEGFKPFRSFAYNRMVRRICLFTKILRMIAMTPYE